MAFEMDEMTPNEPPIKEEKRRGARFPVVVPVEAKWQEAGGKNIKETANAIEVNAQGGLLQMKVFPSVGSHLDLKNLLSAKHFGRVLLAPAAPRKTVCSAWRSSFWFRVRLFGA